MTHDDDRIRVRQAYGPESSQFGLLELPAGPGPFPVLVVLHGGFWRAARSIHDAPTNQIVAACASRPVATWNLEYRRLGEPGTAWPSTLQDVGRGIDFLRPLARRHPLDLSSIGVVGHSAGGHLALWSAGRSRIPRDSELFVADALLPTGVVSLAGITDLERAFEGGLSNETVTARLMEGSPEEVPERYAAASPTRLLPAACPVALLHGSEDEVVALEQAERYAAAARIAGSPCETIVLPGANHDVMLRPGSPEWDRSWQALVTVAGVPDAR